MATTFWKDGDAFVIIEIVMDFSVDGGLVDVRCDLIVVEGGIIGGYGVRDVKLGIRDHTSHMALVVATE